MIPNTMLCCGGEKESTRDLKSAQNTPSRQMLPYSQQQQHPSQSTMAQHQQLGPPPLSQQQGNRLGPTGMMGRGPNQAPMGLHHNQNMMNSFDHPGAHKDEFRKPTGISEEVFRQIETVQNRYDSSTAEAFRVVQKSGEMVVRTLDPRQFIRLASETVPKINIDSNDPDSATSFVEIVKRPGQTLGLYIREGNGMDRSDGVFISRIALESSVYSSGCLQIGDEILAVNLVDVTRMSLDDVVIIMSIPRRLVLTTRRSRSNSRFGPNGGMGPHPPGPGRVNGDGGMKGPGGGPPVVVFKGEHGMQQNAQNHMYQRGENYDGVDSPRRDYGGNMQYREARPMQPDARTLTWDRNPKPDRSDPKYFPVNSLPRHVNNRNNIQGGPNVMDEASPVISRDESMQGMPPPMRELNTGYQRDVSQQPRGGGGGGLGPSEGSYHQNQMQSSGYYSPNGGLAPERSADYGPSSSGYPQGDSAVDNTVQSSQNPGLPPGRGQRLLHRMAQERNANRYGSGPGSTGGGVIEHGGHNSMAGDYRSSNLHYSQSRGGDQSYGMRGAGYHQQMHHNGMGVGQSHHRSRHHSGLDYASDTDALQSPVLSVRGGAHGRGPHGRSMSLVARSSSLPRTFQKEALLRHPELSMEMDRLAPGGIPGLPSDDPLSDPMAMMSGSEADAIMSARKRGYRSPASINAMGVDGITSSTQGALPGIVGGMSGTGTPLGEPGVYGYKELRRTPSTSAIYETLRRSKELRESLTSRPSSRLSIDNNMPTGARDPMADAQYFSDSEHQLISGSLMAAQRQDIRRMRNRTLSGVENMRMVGGIPTATAGGMLGDPHHLQRPGSAGGLVGGSRPITPSFSNDKDPGQQFVDFNPADFIKYKSECDPESSGLRLSGTLSLNLLSGRGLRTGSRSQRRIRDLYCVVEVDHIHKARTVVRSGGVNFDWDEKFELDLANNLEVEFLVYSWDPQLRHRLCYRSSLRLASLFGKGQTFQQVALRMHPTGNLYLTLRFADLREAYDRTRNTRRIPAIVPGPPGLVGGPNTQGGIPPLPPRSATGYRLFGANLETVLEREQTCYEVPLLVKRCIDEVEKRGLDIIGLYRLCGAETKKNMLRQAFEESPEIVDLSSENVPDINVITSLLKEYLRELPEPVFSNCLYQMLVDAMGVFLPDDPDGNAKLVFSILDCLPKANRTCLVHVMDHLSRVTSQSSRNKMNPQNLAICFAPVLMMDFSSQSQPVATNISEPIQILKYLIEIWPKNQPTI